MAKLKKPSQRSIDLYNQLVANQNMVRSVVSKMHKQAEETTPVGRLPALVIPKKAHKIRNNYFEGLSKEQLRARLKKFWSRYRLAKSLFAKGVSGYLKRTVMEGYKELWLGKDGIGVEPEGNFGRFTQFQIANSEMGVAMEAYNMLFTHGVDLFMALLYTHKIVQFTFIYDDLHNRVEKNSQLYQQIELIKDFVASPKKRMELYNQVDYLRDMPKNKTYSGKHKKSTLKKAEEDEDY